MRFEEFLKHKTLVGLSIATAALFGAAIATVAAQYGRLAPYAMLHFDAFRGADIFGPKSALWWMIAFGAAACAANVGLAWEFYRRERFLSYLLFAANALLALITLAAVGTVVSMN